MRNKTEQRKDTGAAQGETAGAVSSDAAQLSSAQLICALPRGAAGCYVQLCGAAACVRLWVC